MKREAKPPKSWLLIARSFQVKAGIILALTILYVITFKPITERYGIISGPLVAIPVLLAGWFFGRNTGFFASLISILLNAILFTTTVSNGWEFWVGNSWFGNLMVVLVGVAADRSHNFVDKREHVEAALRTSEARYRAMVEDQTELVCRMTPDGKMTFVNQSYLSFFNKTLEELIGSSIESRDINGQSTIIKSSIAILGAENPIISFEEYMPQPDGSKHWVQWVDRAIIENGMVIEIQAVGRDITARKQAENKLMRSERRLSEAQSSVRMGNWEWDILANKAEWSSELYDIFGITPEVLVPNAHEGFLNCIHPLDRESVAQVMEHARAVKEPFSVEYRIIRPDSIERYIHSKGWIIKDRNGQAVRMRGSSQDITERKLTENEMRRRERYFSLLNEITHTILAARDSNSIYQTLACDLANLFEADNCYITNWDEEEQQTLTVVSATQVESLYPSLQIKPGEATITALIMDNGQVVAIEDMLNSPHIDPNIAKQFSYQAALGIPLLVGKHKLGAALIAFTASRIFPAEEIAHAEQAGQQIALALWTVQQEIEIQKQLRESDMLSKIARTLSETEHFGLQTVLQLIVTSAKELIPGAQQAIIHLLDEDGQTLSPGAVAGFAKPTGLLPPYGKAKIPISEGVAGQVIAGQETINIADVKKDERFISFSTPPKFRSLMVAPVKSGEKKLGTISIQSALVGAFTEDESRLLNALGTQAAIAIENANLLENTKQALKESNALYRINQELVASLETEELLKDVVNLLQKNFGYYHVQIYVAEPGAGDIVLREGSGEIGEKLKEAGHRLRAGDGIAGYAAETGEPFFTNDVDKIHFFVRNPLLPDTKSELAVPVKIGGRVLGILDIQQIPPAYLSQRDIQLVSAVADQLAVALQKANLYEELQTSLQQEKAIRNQLVQNERLAVMGRLLASVSHELNNPLQAIQNALFLLKEEKGISTQGKQDLNIVLAESERMANMIEQLRATYRPIQTEDFRPTLMNEIIEDVYALISPHLRHNQIAFEFHPQPELPAIPALSDQIRQVVLNLLMNAVEAMPAGGNLTVSTKLLEDINEILFTVSDTGTGISPAILPNIFEAFVTNKPQGTGLGLTITYDIVIKHHGRITAENDETHGSIFKVWLPTKNRETS